MPGTEPSTSSYSFRKYVFDTVLFQSDWKMFEVVAEIKG